MASKVNHTPKPTEPLRHAAAGDGEQELVAVEYPQRPWEPDCSYYLKFGRCGHGMKCMLNHPPCRTSGGQWLRHAVAGEKQAGQETEYPQRPGEPDCSYYVKFGSCKFQMNCRFNHPPRKQVCFSAVACNCNHEGKKPELNSLGLPLRPGTGVCSYYMHKGICKFGANCRFHHPDRLGPEQENWDASQGPVSSQHNSYSRLGVTITPPETETEMDPFLPLGPPPLDLPTPFLLHKDLPCAEQSQSAHHHQLGGSHFDPAKRVGYTRDQLLQLREKDQQIVHVSITILELKQQVDMELHDEGYSCTHNGTNVHSWSNRRYDLVDGHEWRPWSAQIPKVASEEEEYWDNGNEAKKSYDSSEKKEEFCRHNKIYRVKFDKAQAIENIMSQEKIRFAAIENEHVPNITYGDMLDSSLNSPEANLAVKNTTVASQQGSCDASIIGKTDKDVTKKPKEEMLRKYFAEESNLTEPNKNCLHEESNHLVEFDVSPSNSMASMDIDQVGCNISEIIKLLCKCCIRGRHA